MRRLRLRWRLAASHAVLAILLVAFAGDRIGAQAARADRDHATAIAERDSDVLAARSSRMFTDVRLLEDVLTDEQQGSRRAEVVSIDRATRVGSDLAGSGAGAIAAARVLTNGSPTIVQEGDDRVIAASPVVVDSALVGVALVAETVAAPTSWFGALGRSVWIGGLVVAMAALAGWFLAGLWSRPISALTDDVRGLALGSPITGSARGAIPEVDTLAAAIAGIAGRERRRVVLEAEHAASLRMLTRRLSHQLRTPLTVLRLRLDDLSDPALEPVQRDLLTAVVGDQIDQLDRLGEQLAGLDPTRWELDRHEVDLRELVTEIVRRHRPLARWGAVTMTMDEPPGPAPAVMAWIDVGMIGEAVANVVQNAIKYTPRGGRIDVGVRDDGEQCVVVVSDTGPGIGAHEREHVVRSGGRGAAAAIAPGTGHGLAVVTDAAQRHGGHVELDDTVGGGATVRIMLPHRAV
jgi:signal transduction histidine kinase